MSALVAPHWKPDLSSFWNHGESRRLWHASSESWLLRFMHMYFLGSLSRLVTALYARCTASESGGAAERGRSFSSRPSKKSVSSLHCSQLEAASSESLGSFTLGGTATSAVLGTCARYDHTRWLVSASCTLPLMLDSGMTYSLGMVCTTARTGTEPPDQSTAFMSK